MTTRAKEQPTSTDTTNGAAPGRDVPLLVLAVAALASTLVMIACSSSSAGGNDTSGDAGLNDAQAAQPDGSDIVTGGSKDGGNDANASDSGAALTINGTVVSLPYANPLGGRKVTLYDAKGGTFSATTGADGSFSATGIRVPYDARIDGTTSTSAPTIYLGLSSAHPKFFGFAVAGGTTRNATVHIPFQGPSCGAAGCGYTVSTTSPAPNLGAISLVSGYQPAMANDPIDATHTWLGGTTATVSLNILVTDTTFQTFWHYYTTPISVTDTQTTNLAQVTPTSVSTVGTANATVTTKDVPGDWAPPQVQFSVAFPGAGYAYLAGAKTTILSTGVPNIVGGTLGVSAHIVDPLNKLRASNTSVSKLPLNTAQIPIDVTAPPLITAPVDKGHQKVTTPVAWTLYGAPAVSWVSISDVTVAGAQPTIFLAGTSLDLTSLSKFGLSFPPADYEIDLVDLRPAANIDSFAEGGVLYLPSTGQMAVTMTIDP